MTQIEHKRDRDLPADTVREQVPDYDRVLSWTPRGNESSR